MKVRDSGDKGHEERKEQKQTKSFESGKEEKLQPVVVLEEDEELSVNEIREDLELQDSDSEVNGDDEGQNEANLDNKEMVTEKSVNSAEEINRI